MADTPAPIATPEEVALRIVEANSDGDSFTDNKAWLNKDGMVLAIAAADAAHRIAAGIRTLASTVPGGEETGWRSMESAPRGRHVLLIDTSSGTHVFHSVGFRPPGGGPWETDAGHYMEFTPTGWMALLPPPHAMKEEDLG